MEKEINSISECVFAVLPDSERYGLAAKNEVVAVFKYENHAKIFGTRMWGKYYVIKTILSELLP